MHIEPGFIPQAKVLLANGAAGGVLLMYSKELMKRPADVIRTLLAAVFFTLFMQSFHMNIGPSELHFVGAMAMYLTLGFIPVLFGFALGLLLQAMLFNPADAMHLAVNSLSLIMPLIAVHYTLGRKVREQSMKLRFKQIMKLDAMYYAGVTGMVGFWLMVSDVATPFSAWLAFASSYLAIVLIEPVVTYAALSLLKRYEGSRFVDTCFDVQKIQLAK
ncbi:MAG: energy-coupling factor ABC transporter permease [Gammaproteobacteria bacterium]|nr:energy-coupling factor ABC transporter permease [Gammaproteobacteria bacterium]